MVHVGPIPWHLVALVAISILLTILVTRQPVMLGILVGPLAAFVLVRCLPHSPIAWTALVMLTVTFGASVFFVVRRRLLVPTDKTRGKVKFWRFLLRPAAMAFPVLLFTVGRTFTLILLGAVTLVFAAMDITRLSAGRVNLFLLRRTGRTFKDGEKTRVSSMTGFLIASLFVILIFDRSIAVYAMAFLVFGDFFAKYFGLQFGRTPLFQKTLEGSLAHLLACLIAGGVIAEFVAVPVWIVACGAMVATVFEVLPTAIDDNLTVGISSAAVMHVARLLSD
jgi:glycerol-3-phosphate acyltransferase PlsY